MYFAPNTYPLAVPAIIRALWSDRPGLPFSSSPGALQSSVLSSKFEAKLSAEFIQLQDPKTTLLMHLSFAPELILRVSTDTLWS